MSCPQCFAGHVNPGQPTGRWETLHGLKTYIAEPKSEAKGIIVIIPDAFGVGFINNQILADHYAAAGQYLVYLPDFMMGTEAPVSCMKNMAYLTGDASLIWAPYYLISVMASFIPFLIRNRWSARWPVVTKFLTAVREGEGANLPIGIAGFCWGGLHGIYLTHDIPEAKTTSGKPLVDAVFVAHPSSVKVPGDIKAVTRPLSIAIGDDDIVMAIGQVKEAEKVLEGKSGVQTETVIYPGAKHGFAVRASRVLPDSKETQQAEEAEQQAISWFQKHFAKVKL